MITGGYLLLLLALLALPGFFIYFIYRAVASKQKVVPLQDGRNKEGASRWPGHTVGDPTPVVKTLGAIFVGGLLIAAVIFLSYLIGNR